MHKLDLLTIVVIIGCGVILAPQVTITILLAMVLIGASCFLWLITAYVLINLFTKKRKLYDE